MSLHLLWILCVLLGNEDPLSLLQLASPFRCRQFKSREFTKRHSRHIFWRQRRGDLLAGRSLVSRSPDNRNLARRSLDNRNLTRRSFDDRNLASRSFTNRSLGCQPLTNRGLSSPLFRRSLLRGLPSNRLIMRNDPLLRRRSLPDRSSGSSRYQALDGVMELLKALLVLPGRTSLGFELDRFRFVASQPASFRSTRVQNWCANPGRISACADTSFLFCCLRRFSFVTFHSTRPHESRASHLAKGQRSSTARAPRKRSRAVDF